MKPHAVNLKDREIGPLTVLRESSRRYNNSMMWWCHCSLCGEEGEHSARKLIHNADKIKSCGCKNGYPKGNAAPKKKGRQVGAKGKKPTRDLVKVRKAMKPINLCYGCGLPIRGQVIEREIDGKLQKICKGCAQKYEARDKAVVKTHTGKYYKKKKIDWEIGLQAARECGGGRYNFWE